MAKNSNTKARTKAKLRRPSLRAILIISALLVASATGLRAYKQAWETTHDLSAIGNGVATVVQIHDPGCRLCRSLKSNTETAMNGLSDSLQYRIADIHTPGGRRLQHRYEVPHVTLLLFEPDGSLARTLTGVKSVDTLRGVFERFLQDKPRHG